LVAIECGAIANASASSIGTLSGESYLARRLRSTSLSKALRIDIEKYVVILDFAGSYVVAARQMARYATLVESICRSGVRRDG
jgi:hypothetical protein